MFQLATSKGCIAGDLIFQDTDNNYIDCRHTQMVIHVKGHNMTKVQLHANTHIAFRT